MLILAFVLKESLRTSFKSCPCGSGPCPYPCPCKSGHCPCPCDSVLEKVFNVWSM